MYQSKAKSINEELDENFSKMNNTDFPELISQLGYLKSLEKKTNAAQIAAENAKISAQESKNLPAGWFKKQDAIEALQKSGVEIAKAVDLQSEAQKLSFQFQQKLAEVSKYLFGLGVSNIANNRFVVRELELRLKNASEEELSELAKQELLTVIRQLKAQEDVVKKLKNLTVSINNVDEKISLQSKKSECLEKYNQLKIDGLKTELSQGFQDIGSILDDLRNKDEDNLQIINNKIGDLKEDLDKGLNAVNTKFLEILNKQKEQLEVFSNKIVDLEEALTESSMSINSIIVEQKENFDRNLNSNFSKIQEVENSHNSNFSLYKLEITRNRKKINFLVILLIINMLAVVVLLVKFS